MNDIGIGTDIEKVARFKNKTIEKDAAFLNYIFTKNELEYSFSDKKAAQHLCVRYSAKEAVIKALYSLNITDVCYKDIEISNSATGVPQIAINKYKNLQIKVSLSHTVTDAIAFVLITK